MTENSNKDPLSATEVNAQVPPKRPNESGSLRIDSFVKIHDPNTKEVIVETRE